MTVTLTPNSLSNPDLQNVLRGSESLSTLQLGNTDVLKLTLHDVTMETVAMELGMNVQQAVSISVIIDRLPTLQSKRTAVSFFSKK